MIDGGHRDAFHPDAPAPACPDCQAAATEKSPERSAHRDTLPLGQAPTSRGYYPSGELMQVGDRVRVVHAACVCINPETVFEVAALARTHHPHLSEQWIAASIFAANHPRGGLPHYYHPAALLLVEPAP